MSGTCPHIARGYFPTTLQRANAIVKSGFAEEEKMRGQLGRGIYLLQDALGTAWRVARKSHGAAAAVVRVEVLLAECMDLLDPTWLQPLRTAFDELVKLNQLPPTPTRPPDDAVISYTLAIASEPGNMLVLPLHAVRAAFHVGTPFFPASTLAAIEIHIAMRDNRAIHDLRIES